MRSRVFFIIFVLVSLLAFQIEAPKIQPSKSGALAQTVGSSGTFSAPEIEGEAALAQDFLTGEIVYEKNAIYPLPLASLTKIISSLAILDSVSLDEDVGTQKDEHFRVRDVLAMIMVESSNGAVETLFKHVVKKNGIKLEESQKWFLELMSKKAESLGGVGMIFSTIDGADASENSAGAMGSAEAMLKIAEASLDSPLWQFGAIHKVISKEGLIYPLKPTNNLEGEIPGLLGAKTGLTDLAGGNLLVIFEHPLGHPIGIVVLGSSEKGRFDDVKKIYEWIKSIRAR